MQTHIHTRQGQKSDRTGSPGSDHSDQLGLTRIGLKILRGTRTDLKIFRYKKYDLPQTSPCIGLHFMQQQRLHTCPVQLLSLPHTHHTHAYMYTL